jgi:hypothetical protein
MLNSLSRLSESQLEQVVLLEKSLGKELLAFSGYKAEPDSLDAKQLEAIHKAEKKLGLCLVAVKP